MRNHHSFQRLSNLFSASAALALGLAACGGSDGTTAPATPPVITVQPQSLSIGEGGSGTVSVSATSDGGAIAYQWFNVSTSTNIAGGTAASLVFGPISLAANGTQYNVGLSNTGGTTTSMTGMLSVSERSWHLMGIPLASGVRQLATVVDSNGHTHLLAVTGNNLAAGVAARIKLKSNDAANEFVVPGNAALQASENLGSGTPTTSISAVANGSGHVMAAWHRNGIVGAALYTPGSDPAAPGSWQLLPTRINAFSSSSALDVTVAALGNTEFEFAWRERISPSGAHDIMTRRYTIGSNTLGTSVNIENQAAETEAPRMVSDAAGNVLVAWRQIGLGVVVNRRLAGAPWTTALTAVDVPGLALEVLRANANGKAILLTSDRVGTASATRLDLAATVPLLASGAVVANAYGSAPDALVDNNDRIHVFGVSVNTGGGNVSRLFRWVFVPGTGWGAAEAVSDINPGNFLSTGLGVYGPQVSGNDAEGNFIVSWQDRLSGGDNPSSEVRARRFHAGLNAWRSIARVGDNSTNLPLRLTLDTQGSSTLVSAESQGQSVQSPAFY